MSPRQAIGEILYGSAEEPEPTGALVVGSPSTSTVPASAPDSEDRLAELVTSEVMNQVAAARRSAAA